MIKYAPPTSPIKITLLIFKNTLNQTMKDVNVKDEITERATKKKSESLTEIESMTSQTLGGRSIH